MFPNPLSLGHHPASDRTAELSTEKGSSDPEFPSFWFISIRYIYILLGEMCDAIVAGPIDDDWPFVKFSLLKIERNKLSDSWSIEELPLLWSHLPRWPDGPFVSQQKRGPGKEFWWLAWKIKNRRSVYFIRRKTCRSNNDRSWWRRSSINRSGVLLSTCHLSSRSSHFHL